MILLLPDQQMKNNQENLKSQFISEAFAFLTSDFYDAKFRRDSLIPGLKTVVRIAMPNKEILKNRYQRIYNQLQELLDKTENKIARMATVAALLHSKMPQFFWTGFYILSDGELIVGPYQGPLACQVLEKKKGVCWAGVLGEKTIIVPDVHKFPGHIPCDSRSNSEIIVPLFNNLGRVWSVLDIDSQKFNTFSEVDKEWLEKIVKLI